ncbi:MAG: hemerythrin domain-containing protein [Betaproteobacteria bacterium]|jgi:regulator of sigma D|nr:hemerythrin domain-containing protein [Betaproteobacteria bacterium]
MDKPGFFSNLFNSKTGASLRPEESQPENFDHLPSQFQIGYDSNLIRKLREDHAELLRLFNEIKAFSEYGGYAAMSELLASFQMALQTHLMLEDIKFYTYLQQLLAKNTDLSSFISNVKQEMDGIANAVMCFTDTYKNQKMIDGKDAKFKKELSEIGDVLLKRINLEETRLFSLYIPSYQ